MASFDVIFIGGGPAGYVGAIRCAIDATSSGRATPERAPSRSTRCTRRAPASTQRAASSAGSAARATTSS